MSGSAAVLRFLQDERIIEVAFEAARAVLPPEKVLVGSSMSASDDFAFFAEKAPSVYVMLGGGTKEEGYPYQNHHPAFAFDERCLIVGTRFEVAMAKRLLAEPQH